MFSFFPPMFARSWPRYRNALPRGRCISILRARFEQAVPAWLWRRRKSNSRPSTGRRAGKISCRPGCRSISGASWEMWRQDILNETDATLEKLRLDTGHEADLADRAAVEAERSVQLRTRDRARKLICKIEAALRRIEDGSYGYCEETAEPISIRRLRGPPDRDPQRRGAGAPRAPRAHPPRRLMAETPPTRWGRSSAERTQGRAIRPPPLPMISDARQRSGGRARPRGRTNGAPWRDCGAGRGRVR